MRERKIPSQGARTPQPRPRQLTQVNPAPMQATNQKAPSKPRPSQLVLSWDASASQTYAFRIICLKVAQALGPTRHGVPVYPETDAEKAFVARFHEFYDPQEREAALESTMSYFVGGTLQAAVDAMKARRRRWKEI